MSTPAMRIDHPEAYFRSSDFEIMARVLPLHGARLLELGCGKAETTRRLAEAFDTAAIIATEVDREQHAKNLAIGDLPGVTFVAGGAEAIDQPDASIDAVIMLKSLHHVPVAVIDQALAEIARVLRPGGRAYLSEPVYRGDFNDILRLFHDEQQVRTAAFAAVQRATERGPLRLAEQIFFESSSRFANFAEFEDRVIGVTHTDHQLDDDLLETVKAKFEAHRTPEGVEFINPHRVDLLEKPA